MTDFLRAGWRARNSKIPAGTGTHETRHHAVQLQKIELLAEDALKAGPVTLWDVLSGKVASRIPNLYLGAHVPWGAWDPCSKYRSRSALSLISALRTH